MRIVYVLDSLAHKGGAERIITEKVNYLASLDNYTIYIITCYQFPQTMTNVYQLSSKVMQINLCIPSHIQYKYPKKLWLRWKYNRMLRNELQKTINAIKPDILIGVGHILADAVCSINSKAAKIIESHQARSFTMTPLQDNVSILSRINLFIYRKAYLSTIEKKADVVVALTKEDAAEWRNAKCVKIIPDFSIMPISRMSNYETKKVITVGRLEWQKGYDRLINIWKIVTRSYPDWKLEIYGEGAMEFKLRNSIDAAGLNNILIHPFTSNISEAYADSSIFVLTSHFEGFSLVLLEALCHGLPCISFNCPYGPSDIIDNEICGYIIENGNIEKFAQALCELMGNSKIRKSFSEAAIKKGLLYNVDNIMQQWILLFESLTK